MTLGQTTNLAALVCVAIGTIWLAGCTATGGVSVSEASSTEIDPGHWSYSLSVPEGKGPFPTVVMLPGCDGWTTSAPSEMYPHGSVLKQNGFAVVYLDVLAPHGFQSVCRNEGGILYDMWDVGAAEASAAAIRLKTNPLVDGNRLAFLGSSYGGGVALRLASPDKRYIAKSQREYAAVIAYYPACGIGGFGGDWDVPLLILTGELDDWCLAAPCKALASPVNVIHDAIAPQVVVYPGAYHGFDQTRLTKLVYDQGQDAAHAEQYDPEATALSRQEYLRFLRKALSLTP